MNRHHGSSNNNGNSNSTTIPQLICYLSRRPIVFVLVSVVATISTMTEFGMTLVLDENGGGGGGRSSSSSNNGIMSSSSESKRLPLPTTTEGGGSGGGGGSIGSAVYDNEVQQQQEQHGSGGSIHQEQHGSYWDEAAGESIRGNGADLNGAAGRWGSDNGEVMKQEEASSIRPDRREEDTSPQLPSDGWTMAEGGSTVNEDGYSATTTGFGSTAGGGQQVYDTSMESSSALVVAAGGSSVLSTNHDNKETAQTQTLYGSDKAVINNGRTSDEEEGLATSAGISPNYNGDAMAIGGKSTEVSSGALHTSYQSSSLRQEESVLSGQRQPLDERQNNNEGGIVPPLGKNPPIYGEKTDGWSWNNNNDATVHDNGSIAGIRGQEEGGMATYQEDIRTTSKTRSTAAALLDGRVGGIAGGGLQQTQALETASAKEDGQSSPAGALYDEEKTDGWSWNSSGNNNNPIIGGAAFAAEFDAGKSVLTDVIKGGESSGQEVVGALSPVSSSMRTTSLRGSSLDAATDVLPSNSGPPGTMGLGTTLTQKKTTNEPFMGGAGPSVPLSNAIEQQTYDSGAGASSKVHDIAMPNNDLEEPSFYGEAAEGWSWNAEATSGGGKTVVEDEPVPLGTSSLVKHGPVSPVVASQQEVQHVVTSSQNPQHPNHQQQPSSSSSILSNSQTTPLLPMMGQFVDLTIPYDNERDTPVFWHIHKSGGSTAKSYLSDCFDLVEACQVGWELMQIYKKRGVEGVLDDQSLGIISQSNGWRYVNVDASTKEGLLHAKNLGLADSGMADVILTGELPEAGAIFEGSKRRGRVFALFRHPIFRAVSMFYYMQKATWERDYDPKYANMTLEEYAERSEVDYMVRILVSKPFGTLVEQDLSDAMDLVRRKILVGLMDDMEVSMNRFERYFGWTPPEDRSLDETSQCEAKYMQGGENRNKHPPPEEGSAVWNKLMSHNTMDMRLYEFVEGLYQEQASLTRASV